MFSQEYKKMMTDYSVNFYDVCKSADNYFAIHKKGKGSGYKDYLRWKHINEPLFYPTGKRDNIDFNAAYKVYKTMNEARAKFRTTYSSNGWKEVGGGSPSNPNGIVWKWLNHNPGQPRPNEKNKYSEILNRKKEKTIFTNINQL